MISDNKNLNMLVKLSKQLLLENIATSVLTLPFEMESSYPKAYIEAFSKSKSLMIFSLSDTSVVREYAKKVNSLESQTYIKFLSISNVSEFEIIRHVINFLGYKLGVNGFRCYRVVFL